MTRDRRKRRWASKRAAAERAARSQAATGDPAVPLGAGGPYTAPGRLPFEIADDVTPSDSFDSTGQTAAAIVGSEATTDERPPDLEAMSPVSTEPAAGEVQDATDQDEVERSKAAYRALLDTGTPDLETRRRYAWALERVGDWEDALELLDECITEEPDCASALVQRGTINVSHGRYADASRDLENALRVEPANTEAHFNLGLVAVRKGLWLDAIPYLRRAVEIDASLAAGHYYLAEALNHIDDLEGALQSYQRAAELQPTNPAPFYGLGIVLDRLNRPDEAAQMYRRSREVTGR